MEREALAAAARRAAREASAQAHAAQAHAAAKKATRRAASSLASELPSLFALPKVGSTSLAGEADDEVTEGRERNGPLPGCLLYTSPSPRD